MANGNGEYLVPGTEVRGPSAAPRKVPRVPDDAALRNGPAFLGPGCRSPYFSTRYEVLGVAVSYCRTCPSTRLYIVTYLAALFSQLKSRAIASRIISSQPCGS